MATVLKTVIGASLSWVQIPAPPPPDRIDVFGCQEAKSAGYKVVQHLTRRNPLALGAVHPSGGGRHSCGGRSAVGGRPLALGWNGMAAGGGDRSRVGEPDGPIQRHVGRCRGSTTDWGPRRPMDSGPKGRPLGLHS